VQVEAQILEAMRHPRCVGWGEIGLDYHYMNSPADVQQEVFRRQLKHAVQLGKPLTIHTREADDDVERILKEEVPQEHKVSAWPMSVVFHLFSGRFTFIVLPTRPCLPNDCSITSKTFTLASLVVVLCHLLSQPHSSLLLPRGDYVQDQPAHFRRHPCACIPTQAANLARGTWPIVSSATQWFMWFPPERCPIYGSDKHLRFSRPAEKNVITQARLLPFRNASLDCRVHRRGVKHFSQREGRRRLRRGLHFGFMQGKRAENVP
jgi:hypothetical protein